MANSNFVVQNGLTVGPLTIDATTGSITTTGTITGGGAAASSNQIYQGTSNVTATSSFVNVAIASTNVASFSSSGLTVIGTTNSTGAVTITDNTSTAVPGLGALKVTGGGSFGGNLYSGSQLFVGTNAYTTALTNPTVTASGTGSTYTQTALLNNTANGSSDFIAYPSNYPGSSNDHGWADMGFTGPSFNDPAYTITKTHDAYLFGSALPGQGGGNLVLATDWTGSFNDVVIGIGSFFSNAEVARFHGNTSTSGYFKISTGTASTTTTSGALQVTGGVGISGAVFVGSTISAPTIGNTGAAIVGTTSTISGGAGAGTLVATNLSSGNAVITGGSITGATIGATTAVVTNLSTSNLTATSGFVTTLSATTGFSTGNAVISGGSITGATIGATTAVVTNFSSGNITGTFNGTVAGTISTANVAIYDSVTPLTTNQTFYPTFSNISTAGNTATGVNSTLAYNPGTGNLSTTNFYSTGGSIGTLVALTGFSTANAVISGGSITGATIGAGTAVVTNLSSGNAVISGGSITGATIGAGTAVVTNLSSANLRVTGGVDSTGTQTGALQVTGGVGVSGNLWVGGNLYVANIFSVTTNTLTVNDPLVYFVATPSPYNFDIGFYSDFVGGPVNAYGHSGVVRQQTANVWVFFSNVQSEPTTTNINWNDAGIIYDTVKAGAIILANASGTTLSGTTGLLTNFSTSNLTATSGFVGTLNATTGFNTGNLNATNAGHTTMVSTNLSSSNVAITGGSITGATIGATTAVVTNFSSGNAVITGGYSDNHPIGANTKATGGFTTITATGNVAITNTVYTNGLYDSGNRVLSTSSGAGNLSISGTAVTLPATGPGAATTGSGSAIPVVTTDAYGRVAGITTAAVIAPAGTLSGSTLNSGVTASSLTSVGTLTSLSTGQITTSAAPIPNANASVNLGSSSAYWNSFYAVSGNFNTINVGAGSGILPTANVSVNIGSATQWFNLVYGKAYQAQYADLAENYLADKTYPTGFVLMFGGAAEVTVADADTTRVAGVVSTNPAHLMNGGLTGPNVTALALTGRVPTMVIGPVAKGDLMVSAGWGYAKVNNTPQVGTIIGKALQDYPYENKGMIEVVVGRF